MTDKSKWFCSRDVVPDEERLVIIKCDCSGSILHVVGTCHFDSYGHSFYVDSVNDVLKDKSFSYTLQPSSFFTDIDENGDIVHFVYWRYLDE